MEYLQTLLHTGVITHDQFSEALAKIKPRKKTRNRKMSQAEIDRRNALRQICRWMFDIEIDRVDTPLYVDVGDGEKLQEDVFLPIANRILRLMMNDPVIASEKCRDTIIDSIRSLVKIRGNNLTNSKKPHKDLTKQRKRLWLIYQNRQRFVVYDQQGNPSEVPMPEKLPPRPAIAKLIVKTPVIAENNSANDITPPIQARSKSAKRTLFTPTAVITVQKKTSTSNKRSTSSSTSSPDSFVFDNSSDDDFITSDSDQRPIDMTQLLLMQKMKEMQKELDALRAAKTAAVTTDKAATAITAAATAATATSTITATTTAAETVTTTATVTTNEPTWISNAKHNTVTPKNTFICCIGDCQKILSNKAKPDGK